MVLPGELEGTSPYRSTAGGTRSLRLPLTEGGHGLVTVLAKGHPHRQVLLPRLLLEDGVAWRQEHPAKPCPSHALHGREHHLMAGDVRPNRSRGFACPPLEPLSVHHQEAPWRDDGPHELPGRKLQVEAWHQSPGAIILRTIPGCGYGGSNRAERELAQEMNYGIHIRHGNNCSFSHCRNCICT